MADKEFLTVKKTAQTELIERKSRFIGYVCPVADEAEAMAFVAKIKAANSDATHNCYAYQAGANNEFQRSSDDGEPAGTAGRPILEVIKKNGLQNTAVVVTRYFGGILLGAGGLVRAYGKAASLGLAEAGIVCKCPAVLYSATMDYNLWGKVENYLTGANLVVDEVQFLEKVSVWVKVPLVFEADFCKNLTDLGQGKIGLLALDRDILLDQPIAMV